jgi:Endoribonuclease YbeY
MKQLLMAISRLRQVDPLKCHFPTHFQKISVEQTQNLSNRLGSKTSQSLSKKAIRYSLKKYFKSENMFHYTLFNTPKLLTKKYVETVGKALAKVTNIPQKGHINIIVVSPEEIAELNTTYRGKEGPTDILTFPYRDTVQTSTDIAGEIYLCLEKIKLYARER